MCCRPKTSFLIDDILQDTPGKASEGESSRWPEIPTTTTSFCLNQGTPHHTSDMIRMPTLSATRGVYVSDGFPTEDRLRIHDYPRHHSQPLIDTLMTGAPYRGM